MLDRYTNDGEEKPSALTKSGGHFQEKTSERDNFILALREAAKNCPDMLLRKIATDRADELVLALGNLVQHKSTHTMRNLNVAWIRAYNAYNKCVYAEPPAPQGGALDAKVVTC